MRQPFSLVILVVLLLTGCTNSNRKFILGSQRHGLNKVIKTDQEKDEVDNKNKNKGNYEPLAEQEWNTDQEEPLTKESPSEKSELNHSLQNETLIPDSTDKVIQRIQNIDAQLESHIEQLTRQQKGSVVILDNEPEDFNRADGGAIAGAGVAVIILVVIGVILLSILLVYFIAWAIGKVIEDATEDAGCYIATMSYGDYDHPKVQVLRAFRDDFLGKRKWGRQFIRWYYRNSPGFTKFYANNRFVHFYLRQYLNIFVFFIQPFFKSK